MRLLLVHGRSQGGKDPTALKAEWLEALRRGLSKSGLEMPPHFEVCFPFYGDRLDEFVRQYDLAGAAGIAPKGSPTFDEFSSFRRDVAEEMRTRFRIPDAAVETEIAPGPAEKGVQNWAWVQAILRLIDRSATTVSQDTIETFLRDVFLYTKRQVVRKTIDKIVGAELTPDTAVVVGHSLGSVVAYNVLKAANKTIPLYVSVGSPLAIRAIRDTLGPIENPAGPEGWYNAYDPRDVVALYPLDKENFDVNPVIRNNSAVNNWTENRHGIAGYLDDGAVARTVTSGF
jgi:hypothetical protein